MALIQPQHKVVPYQKIYLYVAASPGKGRGVFAGEFIPKGSLIESCPVIVISAADRQLTDQTRLVEHLYEWIPEAKDRPAGDVSDAIITGYGLLYNHSRNPDAQYIRNYDSLTMDFIALRDIPKDCEIHIDYGTEDWPG
jgi:SET domain-containing protein